LVSELEVWVLAIKLVFLDNGFWFRWREVLLVVDPQYSAAASGVLLFWLL
jgi:hypothetical protein